MSSKLKGFKPQETIDTYYLSVSQASGCGLNGYFDSQSLIKLQSMSWPGPRSHPKVLLWTDLLLNSVGIIVPQGLLD